ncbi:hypothetical protein [Clostridium sp. JNZ J1-5]
MGFRDLFNKKKDTEPKVLIESNSPNCNIQAIVEEDNRCPNYDGWQSTNVTV